MKDRYEVVVLVGSLRRESVTRRVAHALMRVAPPSLALRELDLSPLPMYNADLEPDTPPAWPQFRAVVEGSREFFSRFMAAFAEWAVRLA